MQDVARSPVTSRRALVLGVLMVAAGATAGGVVRAEDEEPHWSYEGEAGPEEWGSLDASYATCQVGQFQSPIDISETDSVSVVDVTVDYVPTTRLRIVNNGHTVQVNVDPGSTAVIDGVTFELKQFHFHAPSEHAIDGEREAMELHLVHMSEDEANLAVLGVMLREGEANVALEPVFAHMPAEAGVEQSIEVDLDPGAFLPADSTTFRYDGSLTTPPCSEGVQWLLFAEPVEVSSEQVAVFTAIHDGNARPLQPANERDIAEDSAD